MEKSNSFGKLLKNFCESVLESFQKPAKTTEKKQPSPHHEAENKKPTPIDDEATFRQSVKQAIEDTKLELADKGWSTQATESNFVQESADIIIKRASQQHHYTAFSPHKMNDLSKSKSQWQYLLIELKGSKDYFCKASSYFVLHSKLLALQTFVKNGYSLAPKRSSQSSEFWWFHPTASQCG